MFMRLQSTYLERGFLVVFFVPDLEKMSKAGQHSSPPPICTILEMADSAIPLLLWLSKHQRDNIKSYAKDNAGLMTKASNRTKTL